MFDKLKNLFIVDDEQFKKKIAGEKGLDPETVANEPVAPVSHSTPRPVANTSSTPVTGKVSDKFTNILFSALQKNNLEGFDYLEFRQSLKNLSKMNMDEATRYKSAFALAQTMKATPSSLIQSAQHYLQVLAKEEQKFQGVVSHQRDAQITDRQNQLGQMGERIKAKAEQIKKLSEEIEADQKKMEQLKVELQQTSGKIEQTKSNFLASYQVLVAHIQADVQKMQQYLK